MSNSPQSQNSSQNTEQSEEILPDEVAQNPGARAAATNNDPRISLEEARNATAGKGPNAAGSPATDDSENYVPSNSDPEASDLPSAR